MFLLGIISLVFIIIINMIVLWVLVSQTWRTRINRYFIFAVAFVVLWAIGTLLLIAGTSTEMVSIGRILFLVAPMYTILFLSLFAAVFPRARGKVFSVANVFLAVLTLGFSGLIISDPPLLMTTVNLHSGYNDFSVNAVWYSLYTMYFNIAFFITFSEFFLHTRRARGYQRKQLIYIFSGTMLAALFSLATNLVLPILGVTSLIWLGPMWTLFYVVTVSIAIVRHSLFDIKLAAVRGIVYILALGTMAVIYYFSAYLLSVVLLRGETTSAVSLSPINVVLALGLAFIFQHIKQFFDRVTDRIFYRDRYNSEDFFGTLSNLLSSTIDLRGLLERASTQIASTFKADQAFFFVSYSHDGDHHISAGTINHSNMPVHDVRMLDKYVDGIDEKIFIAGMLPDEESSLKRMLISHRVELVMPLWLEERIVGYVFLGERRSGNYTKHDVDVLSAISSELVIAIQNALSLHELKELNATLQQRIDVATKELRSSNNQLKHLDEVKDEFISMASHQLRTPLTSVKGYLSMVLDGDVGKVTPRQQTLLREAFNSSERMVRLIADFLNVSRLQTGKFNIEKGAIDIKAIIKQEMASLGLIAKTHEIKFRFKITDEDLPLIADESKIQQVVMNLLDNAIYYSHPKSTVVVSLEKVKKDVAFTVVDTGIGVPHKDQPKLFQKFYRAKNARHQRPDGTGVGLFMARRVVEAHNGRIIFSSKEGRGSTFGFSIPMGKSDPSVSDDSSLEDVAKK